MTQYERTLAKDARILALLASGRYEACADGTVLSHAFKGHPGKVAVMKATQNSKGYMFMTLVDSQGCMTCLVHRIIALGLIPNPLGLPEVNHDDLDKTNNAKSNLEWSTSIANTAHAVTSGARNKRAKGSALPQAKLNDTTARQVKDRLAKGDRQSDIARDFGITDATVWAIKNGQTWRHV